MKKFLILSVSVLLSVLSLSAQYRGGSSYQDLYDSETVTAIKNHVRELSAASLEGRKAGSEGERLAAEYVGNMFKEYGIDMITPKDGELFGI